MSNKQNSSAALSLLAGWIVASSIGWAASLALGMLLTFVAANLSWLNEDRVFAYATVISLGFTLGTAQSVVMRRHLPQLARWVTATLIGHLLCLFLIMGGNLVRFGRAGVWDDALLLGLLGTAIGTSQWWILRHHYRTAGLWVLATAVGFLCFLWIIIVPSHTPGELVFRGTIVGALAAAVSGATLVWLMHRPLVTASERPV